MTSYFFDFVTEGGIHADRHGDDLPNLEAVRREAILYLIERAAEMVIDAPATGDIRVIVRDGNGSHILSVELRIHQTETVELAAK
ncbi:MAG: hypothetical protein B7Z23_13125 [Pseudomonadales bacterium 32-61-5]|nr:MAG: hypothetical protein B7Z23_13125 [Pseudomonadales bacterium 32-61-5]